MDDLLLGLAVGLPAGALVFALVVIGLAKYGLLLPLLQFLYRIAPRVLSVVRRGREAVYIERHIERVSQRLERECPGAAPYAPKVRWVRPSDLPTIREGEVILCLSPGKEQPRNLVKAALMYLGVGLVPEARPYMPSALSRSLDLAIARDVVQYDQEAQRVLMTETIAPELEVDAEKSKWFGIVDRLKREGYLTTVYLEEVGRRARGLYPAVPPSPELRQETGEFTYFLNRIARRSVREEVPLSFEGDTLRCEVVLVARSEKLEAYGDAFHWWRLVRKLRDGADTVFLIGLTSAGIAAAQAIASRAVRSGILSRRIEKAFFVSGDQGQPDPRIVIRCIAAPAGVAVRNTPEEDVADRLGIVIPEVADNRVEIVGVAREPGKMTKVALRSRFGESDVSAVWRACSTQAVSRAQAELNGETVHLVPWSHDARQFIASALGAEISHIELEENKNYCLVTVDTAEELAALRGPEGLNIRLAEQLTGWDIGTMTK